MVQFSLAFAVCQYEIILKVRRSQEMLFGVENVFLLMKLKLEMWDGKNVGTNEQELIWIPHLIFGNSLPQVTISNNEFSFLSVLYVKEPLMNGDDELQV